MPCMLFEIIDRLRKTGEAAGENIGIEASLSVVWFQVPIF